MIENNQRMSIEIQNAIQQNLQLNQIDGEALNFEVLKQGAQGRKTVQPDQLFGGGEFIQPSLPLRNSMRELNDFKMKSYE